MQLTRISSTGVYHFHIHIDLYNIHKPVSYHDNLYHNRASLQLVNETS